MTLTTVSLTTHSPAATEAVARRVAPILRPGDGVGLEGDLGSGKTCFTRGLVAALEGGGAVHVSSPTYALLNVYRTNPPVYHFDLYRVSGIDDLETTGYWEITGAADGITVVEWCDRLPEVMETTTWRVSLRTVDEQTRELTIRGPGLTELSLHDVSAPGIEEPELP